MELCCFFRGTRLASIGFDGEYLVFDIIGEYYIYTYYKHNQMNIRGTIINNGDSHHGIIVGFLMFESGDHEDRMGIECGYCKGNILVDWLFDDYLTIKREIYSTFEEFSMIYIHVLLFSKHAIP